MWSNVAWTVEPGQPAWTGLQQHTFFLRPLVPGFCPSYGLVSISLASTPDIVPGRCCEFGLDLAAAPNSSRAVRGASNSAGRFERRKELFYFRAVFIEWKKK